MDKRTVRIIKGVALLLFVGIVATAAYASFLVSQTDVSVITPETIIGGSEEYRYLSAGYMLSRSGNDAVTYCTVVLLDDHTAMTAAHCIRPGSITYLSKGEFKLTLGSLLTASSAITLSSWAMRA